MRFLSGLSDYNILENKQMFCKMRLYEEQTNYKVLLFGG